MLLKPVVTEKTLRETARGRYAFNVSLLDNKTKIKRMVEKMFGVKVTKIQTLRLPAKGKKAIITVAAGQKLALFEGLANR